jgi:hypothetical protein
VSKSESLSVSGPLNDENSRAKVQNVRGDSSVVRSRGRTGSSARSGTSMPPPRGSRSTDGVPRGRLLNVGPCPRPVARATASGVPARRLDAWRRAASLECPARARLLGRLRGISGARIAVEAKVCERARRAHDIRERSGVSETCEQPSTGRRAFRTDLPGRSHRSARAAGAGPRSSGARGLLCCRRRPLPWQRTSRARARSGRRARWRSRLARPRSR